MNNEISWENELGSKIIKEVKLEIPCACITQTQKICLKCNQKFTYERKDEYSKMERPQSPTKEEWIRYKRYATHNLPQYMRDYLEYQRKMSAGILTRKYFEKMN